MGTLGRAVYTMGFWIRETGQALDRLGCRLQGNQGFKEQCKKLRRGPPFIFFLYNNLDLLFNL